MANSSYRIKYNIDNPSDHLKLKIDRNVDLFQVLSLKIYQEDLYKLYTSNYGLLVGRVLANDGFGIPNARISVFIKNTEPNLYNEKNIIYPYDSTTTTNKDNIRYNLLPSEKINNCHQNVGTFPSKRKLLDNNIFIEVFDDYYKYTTTTNSAGDYMIFGIPTGQHQIHVDIDLSDIGVLSQTPRDMEFKGYDIKQFENPNKFKKSTNLDSLPQIISENSDVYIYPFWGDKNKTDVAISKKNINIRYKFEPTCVFMGSIFTDSQKNTISKSCKPSKNSGKMNELVAGQGSIEMIRCTTDGKIEQFEVSGNRLIDDNGVWCYQIPMNLDYVITDEYGNIKPTNNPEIGIPTRAKVRFRVKIDDNGDNFTQTRTASYLIPNNPQNKEEEDYNFDTNTKENSFIDLMWNKVYSIKNYIPRIQKSTLFSNISIKNRRFNGIKSTNNHEANNPVPYNNIWVDINLKFSLICMLTKLLIGTIRRINDLLNWLDNNGTIIKITIAQIAIDTSFIGDCDNISDIIDKDLYVPNSKSCRGKLINETKGNHPGKTIAYEGTDSFYGSKFYFDKIIGCVETTLSNENDVINFDFTNDWLNGCLYAPRFYVKSKKNKKNGNIKNIYCGSYPLNEYPNLNIVQTCAIGIKTDGGMDKNTITECEKECYKKTKKISITKGCVMPNMGEVAYYRSNEIENDTTKYFQPTEIILLGSLNNTDINGIPMLHKQLPSTTFKLPPDVVDEESSGFFSGSTYYNLTGYNYTLIDSYTYFSDLSGTTGDPTKLYYVLDNGNSEAAYYMWNTSKYNDVTEKVNNPSYGIGKFAIKNEYRWVQTGSTIETSGIDWGNTGITTNGLFLGVTCMDSFTNIKSCINANRICELGVDLDEHYIYDNGFIQIINNVDGYISNEEISDGDGRGMFATLNYNKLATKKTNNIVNYDFDYIYPEGFDGRLRSKKKNDLPSNDYYKFRFGKRNDSLNDSYYTYLNDGELTFPKYENSYYFYFGLKPGNTAIDIFNSKYFASCEELKKDAFDVILSIRKNESICPGFDGEINVNVSDAIYPFSIFVDDTIYEANVSDSNFIISGLTSKYYNIKITDANENLVIKNIFLQIGSGIDFNYEVSPSSSSIQHDGYISISNIINDGGVSSYEYELINSHSKQIYTGSTNNDELFFGSLTGDNYTFKIAQQDCNINFKTKAITVSEPPIIGELRFVNGEEGGITRNDMWVEINGNIISDGYPNGISEAGFYWNQTGEPIIENKTQAIDPIYDFKEWITGLTENTTYYIKAYASNGFSTIYSNVLSGTTKGFETPTIVSSGGFAASTTIDNDGYILNDGGKEIFEYGICWKQGEWEELSIETDSKSSKYNILTTGDDFKVTATGLTSGTTYSFSLYCINDAGISYYGPNIVNTLNGDVINPDYIIFEYQNTNESNLITRTRLVTDTILPNQYIGGAPYSNSSYYMSRLIPLGVENDYLYPEYNTNIDDPIAIWSGRSTGTTAPESVLFDINKYRSTYGNSGVIYFDLRGYWEYSGGTGNNIQISANLYKGSGAQLVTIDNDNNKKKFIINNEIQKRTLTQESSTQINAYVLTGLSNTVVSDVEGSGIETVPVGATYSRGQRIVAASFNLYNRNFSFITGDEITTTIDYTP